MQASKRGFRAYLQGYRDNKTLRAFKNFGVSKKKHTFVIGLRAGKPLSYPTRYPVHPFPRYLSTSPPFYPPTGNHFAKKLSIYWVIQGFYHRKYAYCAKIANIVLMD
jgi:hypothetical protein